MRKIRSMGWQTTRFVCRSQWYWVSSASRQVEVGVWVSHCTALFDTIDRSWVRAVDSDSIAVAADVCSEAVDPVNA